MNGTIGHLRTVADLVAALNIEAILAQARLASHESATDLDAAVVMGVAALRKVAALVEEATADLVEEATAEEEENDAPSFTRRQVSDLRDEAAKAGDIETVDACETWLFDSTDEDAAEIIDEALSYARAMQ